MGNGSKPLLSILRVRYHHEMSALPCPGRFQSEQRSPAPGATSPTAHRRPATKPGTRMSHSLASRYKRSNYYSSRSKNSTCHKSHALDAAQNIPWRTLFMAGRSGLAYSRQSIIYPMNTGLGLVEFAQRPPLWRLARLAWPPEINQIWAGRQWSAARDEGQQASGGATDGAICCSLFGAGELQASGPQKKRTAACPGPLLACLALSRELPKGS